MDQEEFKKRLENLSPRRREVLNKLLTGQSYEAMADSLGIAEGTLRKHVSAIYDELVGDQFPDKSRIRFSDLETLIHKYQPSLLRKSSPLPSPRDTYIELPHIERVCQQGIQQLGALLVIKAPPKMGKTMLLSQVIRNIPQEDYRSVVLSVRLAAKDSINTQTHQGEDKKNTNDLLYWFCTSVTQMLLLSGETIENKNKDKISNQQEFEKFWKTALGPSPVKCTTFFEQYLLSADKPLVLGLDDLDFLDFNSQFNENVASDFFCMLRSWHEKAAISPIWDNLRLIVIQSKDYTLHTTNRSTFANLGIHIKLEDFTQDQVKKLALRYHLNWKDEQIENLMKLVEGHPYLINQAMENITRWGKNLEDILENAATAEGIYYIHLVALLRKLQIEINKDKKLAWENSYLDSKSENINEINDCEQIITLKSTLLESFKELVNNREVKKLEPRIREILDELGLIKPNGNLVIIRCELYRQFFQAQLQYLDN